MYLYQFLKSCFLPHLHVEDEVVYHSVLVWHAHFTKNVLLKLGCLPYTCSSHYAKKSDDILQNDHYYSLGNATQ